MRIGGGARVVSHFLRAGLVDQLHVAMTPIILGQGVRLWEDLRGFDAGYEVSTEVAQSGVIHVTYRR